MTEELISFASKQDMLAKSKQFWNPDKTQFWQDRHPALSPESFLQDLGGWWRTSARDRLEDPAVAKLSARFLHLGMAAARAAWADSGLDRRESELDPHRAAVVVGSAFGGLDLLEAEQARMTRRRSLAISPYLVPAMIINQAAGQIAQHLRLYGPGAAPANACASGGHAVVLGAMFLRSGEADVALCGAGGECLHARRSSTASRR